MPPSRLAGAARRRFSAADARGKRCGRVLDDHETGTDTIAFRQKGGQPADKRVDEPVDAPLGNRRKFGRGRRQPVHGKPERRTDGMGLGMDLGRLRRAADDRVVRNTRELAVYDVRDLRDAVANGAVHLRHGAQAERILRARSGRPGKKRACRQKLAQVCADGLDAG